MNNKTTLNKPLLIFVSVFVLVSLVISFIYYNFFVFHIVAVDPKNNTLPTSQSSIRISFNHAIDNAGNDRSNVSLSSVLPYEVSYKDKVLTVEIDFIGSSLNKLDVLINDLKSNDSKVLSKKISFDRKYVALKNQTQEEIERQVNQSDSFESDFPLINKLPFMNDLFSIRYEFPDTYDPKMKIIVTNLLVDYENPRAGSNSETYLNNLRKSRTEAIRWLENNGFNKDKYLLFFTEPQLVKKFDGEYYADSLVQSDE